MLSAAPTRVEAALAIDQTRPGNVFASDEPVSLMIETDNAGIDWQITNGFGENSSSGAATAQGGKATITPILPGPGYYELTARSKSGETTRTAFAVLPPHGPAAPKTRFGTMTHFAQGWDTDILPLVAKAGIGSIRDEQYWDHIEKTPGDLEPVPAYEHYMDAAAAAGLTPMIEATFANKLYDDGKTPNTDAGRTGYAHYAAWLATHDPARIKTIEIWNEYNGSFCTGPCAADRPRFYADMLKSAYSEIKAKAPSTTVLGGASVLIPLPYLKAVFENGGLAAMDGVAVHPYRPVPEGVEKEVAGLHDLMRTHGGEKPIWATELGWGDAKSDRTDVARYLTRIVALLLSSGVDHVYWYLARDYQNFTGMGLLRQAGDPLGKYAPTPAYVAYATLISEIGPAKFDKREPLDQRSRVYLFRDGDREVRIAWSTAGDATLDLNSASPITVTDLFGNTQPLTAKHGVASMTLGLNPVFINGRILGINEHRPDHLVADSAEDYDSTQGVKGWSYGWMDGAALTDARSLPATGATGYRDFQPLDRVGDSWEDYWGGKSLPALKIDARNVHPSSHGGRDVWAVRRWTSDHDGPVHLDIDVKLADKKSAGINFITLLDDKVVLSKALGGPASDMSLKQALDMAVRRGSHLDFVVTPGSTGKIDFDATAFTVRITGPPA